MGSPRSINQAFLKGTKIKIAAVIPDTSPILIVAHIVGSTSYEFCRCVIGQKVVKPKKYYVMSNNGVLRESSAAEKVGRKKPAPKKKAAPRKAPKKRQQAPQAM